MQFSGIFQVCSTQQLRLLARHSFDTFERCDRKGRVLIGGNQTTFVVGGQHPSQRQNSLAMSVWPHPMMSHPYRRRCCTKLRTSPSINHEKKTHITYRYIYFPALIVQYERTRARMHAHLGSPVICLDTSCSTFSANCFGMKRRAVIKRS